MNRKGYRIAGMAMALLMAASVLGGCGAAPAPSSGAASGAANANTGKKDLSICMPEDLESFDPTASSAMSTMAITKMLYTRLYVTDENQQPQPLLAEKMTEISDKEVQFTIKKGAKFQDGTEITADDVVASLMRAKDTPNVSMLTKGITSIEKVDDYTIKAVTEGPVPSIQLAMSHPGNSILPKAYIDEAVKNNDWSKPVASGPYVLESRTIGTSVVLKKNDQYTDTATAAKNDSLTFKVVPEASSRTIQVETGEADVNFNFATADYNNVKDNTQLKLYTKTGTVVQYVGVNATLAPFDNAKVRQALNYAVDRESVMAIVADGMGTVTYGVLPPSTLGYVENAGNYSYDPEKAKALLKEAGYENGFDTKILAFNTIGKSICEAVQPYLQAVGINASIETYDVNVRTDMMTNNQVPMFAAQWGAMSDANLVLPRLFTKEAIGGMNFTHYTNPELDKLFASARNTYDVAQRTKDYNDCVKILAEEAPWCPIYIPNSFCLARADLQGVTMDGESIINLNQLHY